MNFRNFNLNVPVTNDDQSHDFDLNVRVTSDDQSRDFDLNILVTSDDQSRDFDLNVPATSDDHDNDGYPTGDDHANAERDKFDAAGINGRLQGNRKNTLLTFEQRDIVYRSLLRISNNGKLKRYATTQVANLFNLQQYTVQRIWKKNKETHLEKIRNANKRGRKKIDVDVARIREIPLKQRTTLESLANALEVSYGTLYRRFKEGLIRRHSNFIKPHIREQNKRSRLQFCLSMIDQTTLPSEAKFKGMYNVVHIDEKWFYMTRKDENYYLHPQEEEPLRTIQSKNFIGKVMFLCAMAHPRFDNEGNEIFSGKIGIFPFIKKEAAQRRSRNREAGTMEIKPITSVTREIVREFFIKEVIPAIMLKWPSSDQGNNIYIQQDNARTHIDPDDQAFQEAVYSSGYDIRLVCQPPNSPDLNILDLGFFNAIQSLQRKACARTFEQLIEAVQKAFDDYPVRKVNHVFLNLQMCMKEVIKIKGCNRYKIPHMGKGRLEREGHLPLQIDIDPRLVDDAMTFLTTQ